MGMDVKVQGTQVSSGKSANLRSRFSCENQNIQKFVFDLKNSTEPNRWNDDIKKQKHLWNKKQATKTLSRQILRKK